MLETIARTVDHPIARAGLGLFGLIFTAVFGMFSLALVVAAVPDSVFGMALGIGGCSGLTGGWLRVLCRIPTLRRHLALRAMTSAFLVAGIITAAVLVFGGIASDGSLIWQILTHTVLAVGILLLLATIPAFRSGPNNSLKPKPLRGSA